ncbi:hypothetical protein PG990_001488 [Apiospora arundinis]|uniref:Fructosamine kinase-domain-containing protein n=1 Tax=Apiospora arundinis TaxID=335852 RepID=A0ABR2I2B8_9PEZI
MSTEDIAKGVAQAKEIDPLGMKVALDRNLMAGCVLRGQFLGQDHQNRHSTAGWDAEVFQRHWLLGRMSRCRTNMHYYICDYVDMTENLPKPVRFGQALAKLHMESMGKPPTGQYGFPVTTHLAFRAE